MKHYNCRIVFFEKLFIKFFFFDIFSRVEHNQNHIHIKVYDDDGAAGRDAIGSAKIHLNDIKKTGHFDQWVKLPKLFGLSSNGEVHVRMNFRA